MDLPLRVLIIEDSEDDAFLIVRHLRRAGYRVTFDRVDTPEGMDAALAKQTWDVVIADYSMPHFNIVEAMEMLEEKDLDVPFIIVSGTIGEEFAVESMRAGAQDYIMKNNLARLVPVVERELRDAGDRRDRKRAEAALRETEEHYATLYAKTDAPILIIDTDGYYLDCNEAALAFLEATSKSEIYERNIDEFAFDSDGETAEEARERLWTDGGRVRARLACDKREKSIELTVIPSVWQGKPVVFVIGRDLTDAPDYARASSTDDSVRFRELFLNAMVGLVRTRLVDGRALEGNEEIARLFGYADRAEFLAAFVGAEHYADPGTRERLVAELGARGEVRNFDARLVRKDGTVFWGRISARLLQNREAIDGLVMDVSAEKQADAISMAPPMRATHPL